MQIFYISRIFDESMLANCLGHEFYQQNPNPIASSTS